MATTDPVTGERQINVPGMGTVSESRFRQMVQNNQLSAGPGGSAMQNAIDSGNYSEPGSGSSPSSSANSSSNGGYYAANSAPETGGSGGSGVAGARDENVYGLRPNDDPTSWAKRAFQQGTADFGPSSVNPYLSQNRNAMSPFAQWYQQRYGVAAPTNALVAAQISGQAPTSDYMRGQMQGTQNGGQAGPNLGQAQSNLRSINDLVNNNGGNPGQQLLSGQLRNDPQLASQMITSQLQSGTGGWGMGFLGNELSNLATQYYNDPANRGPQSPNGTFLNQALKMLGMGG